MPHLSDIMKQWIIVDKQWIIDGELHGFLKVRWLLF